MRGAVLKKYILTGQKLLVLWVLVIGMVFSSACQRKMGDPLAYRSMALSAEISGSIRTASDESIVFAATTELYERTEGERCFLLVFHAPDALAGLSVRRTEDGTVTLMLDGIEVSLPTGSALGGFIKIAEMLDPSEEILRITSISGKSVGLDSFSYLTLVETASERIYIDPHTSYPVRAEFSDGEVNILFDTVSCRT